ncbi:hypothetical protein ACYSNR_14805 [Enterococcus sp. LJL128]|uniref:hypothetical protein n=1 Tax=Enterococcus sp. LJL51 TaxID=3416656 RepID=UPI003CF060AD
MKKNYLLIGSLVFLTALIVGCSNSNDKSKDSTDKSSSETSLTSSKESSESETKQSTAKSGSTIEGSSQTSETSAQANEATPEDQANSILNSLTKLFPADALPSEILTASTPNYVSAATTPSEDQANYRILYYAENHPIGLNSKELNELKPIASFEKITFGTNEEAKAAVDKLSDSGGNPVDLGFGLTGYMQGAAGSSYLTWAEGNWNLTVKASNIEGEDPVSLAKEVVNYLEKNALPAPDTDGKISLEVGENGDYQTNSVIWQKQNVVYKIYHFNALRAIQMAVSAR